MLASTMQISNNNPTNPPPHPKMRQGKGRNQNHQPPHTPPPHTPSTGERASVHVEGLMLQDPTVCQPDHHHPDPTFHTPTRRLR